jgi:Ca2+-binding EF-hand superfamily protein
LHNAYLYCLIGYTSFINQGHSGNISESDVSKGLNEILSDKNNAVMYSFKAYDLDMDNRISQREFVSFIEESWKAAFRILG